jgi:hypothetical protein
MLIGKQIAKHLRDVHFGGNWTCVNLKDTLKDVTWEEANTQVRSFNTITTLVHHISYYVDIIIKVFEGKPLEGKDEESFKYSPITSEEAWQKKLESVYSDVEKIAAMIELLPDGKFSETFMQEKYGSYYRNTAGIVEHTHYHLGQIVFLKKMIRE